MAQTATDLAAALLPVLPFMQGAELKPEIGRVINSAKVSDHHAIIPTVAFAGSGFDGLPESEKKLMSLVCCKLLCAVAAPQEYETVTAVFDCGGKPFTDKGKTILIAGWKDIDARFRAALKAKPDEDSAEDAALPELPRGRFLKRSRHPFPSITPRRPSLTPRIRFCPQWRTRERRICRRMQRGKGWALRQRGQR